MSTVRFNPAALRKAKIVYRPGSVTQLLGYLTHKSEVLGSIPGLATYFRFSSS